MARIIRGNMTRILILAAVIWGMTAVFCCAEDEIGVQDVLETEFCSEQLPASAPASSEGTEEQPDLTTDQPEDAEPQAESPAAIPEDEACEQEDPVQDAGDAEPLPDPATQDAELVSDEDLPPEAGASGIPIPDIVEDPSVVAPEVLNWHRLSQTEMELTWETVEGADGYLIEYSAEEEFSAEMLQSRMLGPVSSGVTVIRDLEENVTYFVRISTLVLQEEEYHKSEATVYSPYRENFSADLQTIGDEDFDFYAAYSPSKDFRVLQGHATDNVHNYYILWASGSSSYNKSVILKVRLSDNKLVKRSAILDLDHGNDMTYNPDTHELLVVNNSGNLFRITFVDPESLKITGYTDLFLPEELPGVTEENRDEITGYSGIAYSPERKQYALRIKKTSINGYVICDENLVPVKYVDVDYVPPQTNQGIDADSDRIYSCHTAFRDDVAQYNLAVVYDWDGHHLYTIRIPSTAELEGFSNRNGILYAGVYVKYYGYYAASTYYTQRSVRLAVKRRTPELIETVQYIRQKLEDGTWKITRVTAVVENWYKVIVKKFSVVHFKMKYGLIRKNYLSIVGA